MQKLKSCPFCNGEPELIRLGNSKQSCIIECTDCGCKLETNESESSSGNTWNRRTEYKEAYLKGYIDSMEGYTPEFELPY